MGIRSTYDVRYTLAAVLATLLILAVALPLYLSGTPKLRANAVPATSAPSVALAAATATSTTAAPSPTAKPTRTAKPTKTAGPTETPAPTEPPAPTAVLAQAAENPDLTTAVETVIDGQPGVFGIVIADAGHAPVYSLNADAPFEAASLYKLVLLADIYRAIDDGSIGANGEVAILPEYYPTADEPPDSVFDPATSPDSVPISEALFDAGAYSSNVAARALLSLTDEASLRATARALGMTESYFFVDPRNLDGWPPAQIPGVQPETLGTAVAFVEQEADAGPIMVTTPRDMATYFQKLLAGEVVNQAVSDQILEILKQQAVDDRFPCLLPDGTQLAHKTGNLDHVVHDVGIIWNGDKPVILIAMIEDSEDDGVASGLIQRLALVAYAKDDDPIAAASAESNPNCGADEPVDEPTAPADGGGA